MIRSTPADDYLRLVQRVARYGVHAGAARAAEEAAARPSEAEDRPIKDRPTVPEPLAKPDEDNPVVENARGSLSMIHWR